MSQPPDAAQIADLGRLRVLLNQLERVWADNDAVTMRYLRPGLSDAQIDAATASLGLTLPVEVREWFAWHDGVKSTAEDLASRLAADFGPPFGLCGLAACVDDTQFQRKAALAALDVGVDPDDAWAPSWLVIMASVGGGRMSIDCSVPTGAVTPIRTTQWDDLEAHHRVRVPSLTALLGNWLDLIDNGIYTYEAESQYWHCDDSRLTLEQRLAAVY